MGFGYILQRIKGYLKKNFGTIGNRYCTYFFKMRNPDDKK